MRKPNFAQLHCLFAANKDFSLTESQYEKCTGAALPKDYAYLKRRSALAKVARQYGFEIKIKEKTICLTKNN